MRPVFGGALDYVASQQRRNAKGAAVTCSVSIGPRDGGGFGLAVKLQVTDESLPQAELEAVTREAQEKNLSVLASDAEKRAGGS
jgi:osmotically inducible protein OsmC